MALRGITSRQEQKASQLTRDVRTMGQKFSDFVKKPQNVGYLVLFVGLISIPLYPISDLLLLINLLLFLFAVLQKFALPFRIPLRAKMPDPNYCIPGTDKPRSSAGIYFFGNDKDTKEELWFTNDDMRTHCLIFGSTGSGKTEALVSLAFNALELTATSVFTPFTISFKVLFAALSSDTKVPILVSKGSKLNMLSRSLLLVTLAL